MSEISNSNEESRRQATKAANELRRRQTIVRRMQEDSFKEQWAFIKDESRLKSALTTRRAGKSMGDALYFLLEGVQNPGVSMLYCGLTDDSAWRILWKDCLRPLGKRYGIKLKCIKSEGTVILEDYGSIIYFLGIDSSSVEMDKALGQKFKLCVIDEAAKYRQDIKALVMDILFPATADYEGTIVLTGMPSNDTKSFFFDVTTGAEPGWSRHEWTYEHNPYTRDQMRKQVAFLIKVNPGIENTSTYKQHYLGKWAIEDNARIYKFSEHKNLYDHLPEHPAWHYVMGVDLGYDPDPTAFVVLAYRDYDPCLYVIDVYMRKKMIITEVAERIKHYNRIYNLEKIIIDNSMKQAVEELKQRFNLSLTPAERAAKSDFIQICNDDLLNARVKVRSINCEPLIAEFNTLVWDEKALLKGIWAEPKRAKNHCCDAFLYAWRYCYNWVDRGVQVKTHHTDEEVVEAFWDREAAQAGQKNDVLSMVEREYGY